MLGLPSASLRPARGVTTREVSRCNVAINWSSQLSRRARAAAPRSGVQLLATRLVVDQSRCDQEEVTKFRGDVLGRNMYAELPSWEIVVVEAGVRIELIALDLC